MGGWCGLERPVLSQCSRTGGSMGAQAPRSCPISQSSETSGVLAITSSRRQMGRIRARTGERGYPKPRPSHFTGGDYLAHFDLQRPESIWQRLTVAADASA